MNIYDAFIVLVLLCVLFQSVSITLKYAYNL